MLLPTHTAGDDHDDQDDRDDNGGSHDHYNNHDTLQFVTTLPRTHYLGVDVSKGLTISHMASHPSDAQYPDARFVENTMIMVN